MLTHAKFNALYWEGSYGAAGHTIISIHTKALFTSIIDIRVIYVFTQMSHKQT
jgi:hypothetical protein